MPSPRRFTALLALSAGVLALAIFFVAAAGLAGPWPHNETLTELVALWIATTWGRPLLIVAGVAFSIAAVGLLLG